jgi:hypothetical protein
MQAEASGPIADAIAILAGRVFDGCPAGRTVPAWVRVNQLAHASWTDLASLAESLPPWSSSAWDGAIMFLAGELRINAGSPEGLRGLQRDGLIPLELDLLDGRPQAPTTPTELVTMIQAEIGRVRRHRSHMTVPQLVRRGDARVVDGIPEGDHR